MDDNNTHLETVLFARLAGRQADRLGYLNPLLFFFLVIISVCILRMFVYYLYINNPCVQNIIGLVEINGHRHSSKSKRN